MERPPDAHELPSGGWFVPRDLDTHKLKRRERNAAVLGVFDISPTQRAALFGGGDDEPEDQATMQTRVLDRADREGIDAALRYADTLVLLAIESWSFGPVDLETLDDLDADDADEIETAVTPIVNRIRQRLDMETPTAPGVDSPTGPDGAS